MTVLWVAALGVPTVRAQELVQQYGRQAGDPGPRAVGLVQLSGTGKVKVRLIPIVIMLDGKFYDAGSYKAAPVPMALDFGVIYEAFHAGVSQGLFTVTQPGQLNHNWIAEGSWLPAGAKAPETTKKYAPPVIEEDTKKDDRPVLHRRAEGTADKDESGANGSTKKEESKPATPSPTAPSTSSPAPSGSPTTPPPPAPTTTPTQSGGTSSSGTPPSSAPPSRTPPETKDTSSKDAAKPQAQPMPKTSDLR